MADEVAVRELVDDARALISEGEWAKSVALVTSLHPADLVDLVLSLEEDGRRTLLDHLPTDIVGQLFEYVEDDELTQEVGGSRDPRTGAAGDHNGRNSSSVRQ